MDFMLNLPISAHNGDVQENSEVHMVREPHGHLEHVHLCDGVSRFSTKSIFKSWFLSKENLPSQNILSTINRFLNDSNFHERKRENVSM